MTKVIKVCVGCACGKQFGEENLKRAEKELGIRVGETTKDGKFKLEKSGCLGQCSSAPNVMICNNSSMSSIMNDGTLHPKVLPNKMSQLINNQD